MNFDLQAALAVLERTPVALGHLLHGLPDSWTRSNEGGESFSPFDVIGHLIDGEETDWLPRAQIILAQQPNSEFAPYDRFRHKSRNVGRTLESLLEEFAALRRANIETVKDWKLSPGQLDLAGRHPALGMATLRQLLSTWVAHDLGHIAQVARVMAKQYRAEVGPWAAYLPVLTDHDPKP